MKAALTRSLSRLKGRRGFSFLEVLVVVSVLGIVATVSVGLMSGIKSSTEREKLQNDVQSLNNAVRIYEATGGSLDGATGPQQVIDKLKTVVNADLMKRIPGLTNSMIDPRLSVATSGTAPEGTFAEWNPDTMNFEVVDKDSSTQAIKIVGFEFGAEPAVVVTEARDPAMLYSKDDTWVWDYQDRAASTGLGPTVIAVADDPGGAIPTSTSNPPPPQTLDPPEFSIPEEGLPDATGMIVPWTPSDFPLSLTLNNPNPPGSSKIIYAVNYGSWQDYSSPISVAHNATISAQAVSLSAMWSDSGKVDQNYAADPVPLSAPTLTFSAAGFDDSTPVITVTITNPNPPGSSTIHYDIRDPEETYSSVPAWPAYGAPFPVTEVEYPLGLHVKAYAKATDPVTYTDSGFTEGFISAATFFGVSLTNNVLFVLDASSSMDEDFGSQSRYEAVIDASVEAIGDLAPSIKFSVSMFDEGIHWTDGSFALKNATAANKASMISQILAVNNDEGTNYQAGLSLPAQFSPLPEMVVFLTDGEPNDTSYDAEVAQLASLGIPVHCLGLALDSDALDTLQDIATATGGTVTEIPEP